MMVTNGLGAILGNYGAEAIINHYTHNGATDWSTCWFIFAGYAFVLGVLFAVFFKYDRPASSGKVA